LSGEPDLEVYLAGVAPVDIIRLLNEASGPFVAGGTNDDGLHVYTCGNSKPVITSNMQDGFVTVWLRCEPRLAVRRRFCPVHRRTLKCRVRCDLSARRSALGCISRHRWPKRDADWALSAMPVFPDSNFKQPSIIARILCGPR
jgi:hypothetical protein